MRQVAAESEYIHVVAGPDNCSCTAIVCSPTYVYVCVLACSSRRRHVRRRTGGGGTTTVIDEHDRTRREPEKRNREKRKTESRMKVPDGGTHARRAWVFFSAYDDGKITRIIESESSRRLPPDHVHSTKYTRRSCGASVYGDDTRWRGRDNAVAAAAE